MTTIHNNDNIGPLQRFRSLKVRRINRWKVYIPKPKVRLQILGNLGTVTIGFALSSIFLPSSL